jgi:uncharacterized lipoprotein YmbA
MKHSKSFTNILLVALAVLLMAGCGGAESRKAKYLERSKNYLEQQNYDKAAVELKNVLQPKICRGLLFARTDRGRQGKLAEGFWRLS